ncbi:MAG: acetaldehyde dehydrogenase / alcohol dehydrogenase [Thermoleophilaceae bacterium]|nr:acetaldehyde dehydrogenase / alcohol dehydrogenase [Thermoleophilaceae bacterium]
MSTIPIPQTSVLDAFQVELLSALQPYMEDVEYAKGDEIYERGKTADAFYIVDAGDVRLEVPSPEPDSENVLDVRGPGSFLGHDTMLAAMTHAHTAVADSVVRGRKVSAKGWRRMLDEDPQQGVMVLRALARQTAINLRAAEQRVAEQLESDAPDPEVEQMVANGLAAQRVFESWDEERVDALLKDIAESIAGAAEELATASVEETHIGNPADKVLKIQMASMGVYSQLEGATGIGAIDVDDEKHITEIAAPVGVVFGLVPVTNPVPTVVNKTLICLKSRNALIYSAHRMAAGVGERAGTIIRAALERHGAPVDLVQWVRGRTSRKRTARFMSHPGIGLVLATGGPSMVKAAYSSGTPAIGVGAGNAPCWVAADANVDRAAQSVILSKGFDNGVICGSEQHLVVDASVADEMRAKLAEHGAAVLSDAETEKFVAGAFEPDGDLKMWLVGQAAERLAEEAGLSKPGAKLIVFEADASKPEGAQARERLAPVLSFFTVDGDDQAMQLCKSLLDYEGTGHTANIHTEDPDRMKRFADAMPASRVLVNVPSAHGCCGIATSLPFTLTLGCGTWGGNITTNNVGHRDVRNVKRMALPREG